MSWDATLIDDRGHYEGEWNYTHNCNCMIIAVLTEAGQMPTGGVKCFWDGQSPWWEALNGCSGPDGAALLHMIIEGLKAEPARFRAMDPANGWGGYDSLLRVLREMRDRVPEWPTTWKVSG